MKKHSPPVDPATPGRTFPKMVRTAFPSGSACSPPPSPGGCPGPAGDAAAGPSAVGTVPHFAAAVIREERIRLATPTTAISGRALP